MAPSPTAPSGPTARAWWSARPSAISRSSAATAPTNCSENAATAGGGGAAALFAGDFPEPVVDAVLPARPALLEVIQHVAVDAQRNLFLGAGHGGLRLRQDRFRRLGRCRLEHRFGG